MLLLISISDSYAGGIGNGSGGSPNISGVINSYTSVTAISTGSCSSSITVLSTAGFTVGDLVLIMQMEGAMVNTSNTAAYGAITAYNGAGTFEYARIFSVAGTVIQTVAPLANSYTILGVVQLIRVPQYINPVINGTLSCLPWNGLTGGVLALDATGTVTFNFNIDVSGNGFRGGQYQPGTDFHLHLGDYSALSYPDSFSLKGEGIASYSIVPYASGRGAAANGGGGGNNHNGGGGGGANGGCGGNGGFGFSDTSMYGANYSDAQGFGGYALSAAGTPSRLFMGGGGGAGNADNASISSGADGGGIVIITAGSINGNGRSVLANGASSGSTVLDGAGGGGAGGSILIDCASVGSLLTVSAAGGAGGSVTALPYDPHGPGGGGGGGMVAVTGAALPANITISTLNGGAAGLCDGLNHGTTIGCNGTSLFNYSYPKWVNNPTVTTYSDTTFCDSGTLSLLCSPGTAYSWSPATGLSCTNCQNPVANVNVTTTYVATATISSCIYIDSFQVTIHPLPTILISPFSDLCEGASSFVLTGATPANGTYSGWGVTGGTFDPALSGIGTGNIIYSYTDSNSCVNTDSSSITVHPLPVVTFPGLNPVCISVAPFVLNGATPSGGTYSGPGISAGLFDPMSAGSGNHLLTYSFTDANGCSSSDSITLIVYALPVVSQSALNAVCEGTPAFLLSGGSPSGGIYSGTGVVGGTFDPVLAGPGVHTINYSFSDSNGCTNSDSVQLQVNALPNVTLPSFNDVCLNSPSFSLTGGLPAGGIYSGNGVVAGSFDPLLAGPGISGITYVFSDINGCTDSAVSFITVDTLPFVSMTAISPLCISEPSFPLTSGNPSGGLYSGNGVNNGIFDPAVSGSGIHQLNYLYTDAQGCSVSDSITVTVYDLPIVNLPGLNDMCDGSSPLVLNGGSPAGGNYSGTGVNGAFFDPAIAGPGVHALFYSFTDTNGCFNSDTSYITVNALPVVQFSSLPAVCIGQPAFPLTGGSPSGGNYSGNQVNAGIFNPAIAGSDTVTYTYTDANGCSDSALQTQLVNALPIVTLSAVSPVCIASAAFPLTSGSPSGGTYSGPGITGTQFDPSAAGLGTHIIYYSYTDANGCSNLDSTTVTVYDLPVIVLPAVNPVCEGTPAFVLAGASPAGGTYSGPGISGSSFDPSVAGIGTHVITYSYTDANGCSNSGNTNITVNALPTVTLSSFSPVCVDAAAFVLSGGNPGGGSYSGSGILAGVFNPSSAGSGTHAVQYAYTDANGCSNSATENITVHALPVVALSSINPVCIASAAFPLTSGSPSGGTYSGPGITGTQFDPSAAGLGTHIIYYSYTDANGCSNLDSTTVTVYDLPMIVLPAVNPVCEGTPAFVLAGASPAGGTYSGPGISGSSFDPAVAGLGTHVITYSYTDANGCSNSGNTNITVNALPSVTLSSFSPVCMDAAAFVLSGGNPGGGSYSGNGILAGVFNPSSAGSGTHVVQYAYTDANGCSNSATENITVHALPVVALSSINPVCIASAAFPLTSGSPSGGVYNGPGITGAQFDPSAAGLGTHIIYYSYTDTNGCSNLDSTTVTVYDLPVIVLPAVNPVCEGTPAFVLAGASPAGGTYSGPGISGSSFDPAVAGLGTHVITYSYTDANGCSNSGITNITVNALPTVTLSSFSPVCVDAAAFVLSGGNPGGGSYSGSGILAGVFNPLSAGSGTHAVQYAYTDANGCSNSATENITVHPLPVVVFSSINPVCIASAAFPLTSGSPSGGTYSGPGITGTQFDPSAAGLGTHIIYYSYTDANGCSNLDSTTVTVYDLPVVSVSTFNPVCIDAPAFQLTGALPAGGIYSGTGVVNNIFYPALAGTGNKTISYAYTDANGCSNSASTGLLVNPLPVVSLFMNLTFCENDSAVALSGGMPAGGQYSGNGVLSGIFNPQMAGTGQHVVDYFFTDSNGCSNHDSDLVIVDPLIYLLAGSDDTLCLGQSVQLNGSGSFSLNWSPAAGLSCTNCPNPVSTPAVSVFYVLSSSEACTVNDTVSFSVIPAITVDAGTDTTICFGSSVTLHASSVATNYSWSPYFSLNCQHCPDPLATPETSTSYIVTVTNGICTDTDTVQILVIHPQVDAGPDRQLIQGEVVQLSATGCSQYSWSPGWLLNDSLLASPFATPEQTTVFTVTGFFEGCYDSDTVIISIVDIGDAVFIPNAFTPNNDGSNDLFGAVRLGNITGFELTIFNRWGQLIYASDAINRWWDGTFKGNPQQEGVYAWTIRFKVNNVSVQKSGQVVLIR